MNSRRLGLHKMQPIRYQSDADDGDDENDDGDDDQIVSHLQ